MIQQIKNSTIESIIKQFKNNNQQIKGDLIIAPNNSLKEEEQNYNIFSNKPLQQKHHEKSLNRYKLMIKNDDIIQNHLKIKEEKNIQLLHNLKKFLKYIKNQSKKNLQIIKNKEEIEYKKHQIILQRNKELQQQIFNNLFIDIKDDLHQINLQEEEKKKIKN